MNNIQIEVNGKKQEIAKDSSLTDVIKVLTLPDQGCVFSINNTIVPKSTWSSTLLNDKDSISLFQAIAGG